MKELYVYLLKCADNSYYTGVTNNMERRLAEHAFGKNPKCYTYKRRPVQLMYYEQYSDSCDAIAREKQIKGWSRKKKEALIKGNFEKLIEYSKNYNRSRK